MAVNIPGVISIIIFYLIILLVGIYAARKRKKHRGQSDGECEDIILAGRNIGWFLGSFTLTATWIGGGFINGTAESIYNSGFVWTLAPWAYTFSLLLAGILFAKKMRERNYVTMLDPLQQKYGSLMGGFLFIPAALGETFYTASILGALGATFSMLLQIDVNLAIIISVLISAGYTLFGGFLSVAYTDAVQLMFMFIGLWFTVPFALKGKYVANIGSTKQEWIGTWDSKQSGVWFDLVIQMILGGIPWQVYYQRVLSSKTPRSAQLLTVTGYFGCILLVTPAVILGAVAKSTDWSAVAPDNPLVGKSSEILDPRFALPMVLQYLTPTWVSFLGLGAISAAVMSSTDSAMLSAASMFTHNIYKVIFRPKASERELMWVIRISILTVGALATIIARTSGSVYALFVICTDLVYVILFPQLLCAIHVPFANTYGSISAYVIGLILRIGGGENLIGLKAFIEYPQYDAESGSQLFPFRTFAMVVNLIVLVLVSYSAKFLFEREILPAKYDILKSIFKDGSRKEADYYITQTPKKRASITLTNINTVG